LVAIVLRMELTTALGLAGRALTTGGEVLLSEVVGVGVIRFVDMIGIIGLLNNLNYEG
jgi:hypothetical protein